MTEEVPQSPYEPHESDDIVIERVAQAPTPKHGNFKISDADINLIINRKELTDHIIGAAQTVLHKQFPNVLGLENTTIGPVFNFSVYRGKFVQILHTGAHHWVLVSNIGCDPASIRHNKRWRHVDEKNDFFANLNGWRLQSNGATYYKISFGIALLFTNFCMRILSCL